MPRPRSCRGQIAIPAMFLLPTLFLSVYLIYDTAKLSRLKIRHQFAVDAAAFVEMTNYSDFLNRSAYVNGAFPMRIFWEGFHDTMLDCMGRDPCPGKRPLSEILFEDGVYPRSANNPDPTSFNSDQPSWDIAYSPARPGIQSEDPDVDSHEPKCQAPCAVIVSKNTAQYWNINWEDSNQIYKLYVQIYQLLGSVESAQFSVLNRLVADHNFLKKSYWLNTGGDTALAESVDLKTSFDASASPFPSAVKFHCVKRVFFHGNQLVHSWGQPYQIWSSDPPPEMPSTIGDCKDGGTLFQLVSVSGNILKSMARPGRSPYPGWPVETTYTVDGNYFNIDLNAEMRRQDNGPRVHATVAVAGFGAKPQVWMENGSPGPTPKFQVRLYP